MLQELSPIRGMGTWLFLTSDARCLVMASLASRSARPWFDSVVRSGAGGAACVLWLIPELQESSEPPQLNPPYNLRTYAVLNC
jgi:hypothetical protein